MAHVDDRSDTRAKRRVRIRNRFTTAGWGLLMLWSGALIPLPGDPALLWHAWLLGAGVIVLGVAGAAMRYGSRPSVDTWILGTVGLVSGLAGLFGATISTVGLGLVLFGLAFVIGAVRASLVGPAGRPGDA